MGVDRSPPGKQNSYTGSSRDNSESEKEVDLGKIYKLPQACVKTGPSDIDEQFSCGKCNKLVKDHDNGVQCDHCEIWYHANCVGIDNAHYKLIVKLPSMDWICDTCKDAIKNLKKENYILKNENKSLKEENKVLRERLAALEKRVNEIKVELKDEIMKEVDSSLVKIIDDFKEVENKKYRENNLVLYNMEESNKADGRDRALEDVEKCHQLILEGVGMGQREYNIRRAIRLGKPQANQTRPRPLLLKLDSIEEKWNILKKAKNIKNYRHPILKKVVISMDLTPREQEKDRMLRQQLKEKYENGEQGWFIRSGKLCKQNFPRRDQNSAT